MIATEAPALSRELTDFLVEFSVGIHKLAIYPDGHPLVDTAVNGMRHRLDELLASRPVLALGVARHQLIVDGVSTDPNSAVMRDLALRLSRREVGAVRFSQGVEQGEISSMLRAIARDAGRERGRGAELAELSKGWKSIRLFPLVYDHLELLGVDGGAADTAEQDTWATQLWVGLARAAMSEDPRQRGADAEPSTIARAIEARSQDTEYGREIVAHLARFAEGIREHGGSEGAALRKRVQQLVGQIDPASMKRLLQLGGDFETQRQLVLDASHVMAVDTVLDLTRAAADSAGQTMSGSMLHLLGKLARHAEQGDTGTRTHADAALRENVRQLVHGWDVGGNTDAQSQLGRLARLGGAGESTGGGEHDCEPERVLQMSLEIGTVGVSTRRALDTLVETGRIAIVIDLLDRAVELNEAVELLRDQFDTPETLALMLGSEPVDVEILGRFVRRLGPSAIEPLLDAFDSLEDRKARWRVFELLTTFGSDAGPAIVSRLPSAPWYVQRNLLALIGRLPSWPENFSPAPFLRHGDARVRREALKLLLAEQRTRVAAMCEAVADADERIVRMALTAAAEGCPPQAVVPIVKRIDDRTLDLSLRVLGVRAVSASRSPTVRDCMLRHCLVGRTGWFRRQKLASKSPVMLAALGVLCAAWSGDPATAPAMRLVRKSNEPDIRALVDDGGTA